MTLSMRLLGDGVNTSVIDDINQLIFTIVFTNKGGGGFTILIMALAHRIISTSRIT